MLQFDVDDQGIASLPGFVIACECGSKRIRAESNVGFSAVSGTWGDIRIECMDCGNEAVIFEP